MCVSFTIFTQADAAVAWAGSGLRCVSWLWTWAQRAVCFLTTRQLSKGQTVSWLCIGIQSDPSGRVWGVRRRRRRVWGSAEGTDVSPAVLLLRLGLKIEELCHVFTASPHTRFQISSQVIERRRRKKDVGAEVRFSGTAAINKRLLCCHSWPLIVFYAAVFL